MKKENICIFPNLDPQSIIMANIGFFLFQRHYFHFCVASFVFYCGISALLDKKSFEFDLSFSFLIIEVVEVVEVTSVIKNCHHEIGEHSHLPKSRPSKHYNGKHFTDMFIIVRKRTTSYHQTQVI